MTEEKLNELRKAKGTICSYCKSDMCEWCVVERIISNAEEEPLYEDEYFDHDYVDRNYGPSNPWDAPGMSIKDFI